VSVLEREAHTVTGMVTCIDIDTDTVRHILVETRYLLRLEAG